MLTTGEYRILHTMAYKHLNSAIMTDHSSSVGNNVKAIHLCINLMVGLWILLNLILVDFPEISSQNSTLLKNFQAFSSNIQELENPWFHWSGKTQFWMTSQKSKNKHRTSYPPWKSEKMWETQESGDMNLNVLPRRDFPNQWHGRWGETRCPSRLSRVTPHHIHECGGTLDSEGLEPLPFLCRANGDVVVALDPKVSSLCRSVARRCRPVLCRRGDEGCDESSDMLPQGGAIQPWNFKDQGPPNSEALCEREMKW
jgi:hypothetical protein